MYLYLKNEGVGNYEPNQARGFASQRKPSNKKVTKVKKKGHANANFSKHLDSLSNYPIWFRYHSQDLLNADSSLGAKNMYNNIWVEMQSSPASLLS